MNDLREPEKRAQFIVLKGEKGCRGKIKRISLVLNPQISVMQLNKIQFKLDDVISSVL